MNKIEIVTLKLFKYINDEILKENQTNEPDIKDFAVVDRQYTSLLANRSVHSNFYNYYFKNEDYILENNNDSEIKIYKLNYEKIKENKTQLIFTFNQYNNGKIVIDCNIVSLPISLAGESEKGLIMNQIILEDAKPYTLNIDKEEIMDTDNISIDGYTYPIGHGIHEKTELVNGRKLNVRDEYLASCLKIRTNVLIEKGALDQVDSESLKIFVDEANKFNACLKDLKNLRTVSIKKKNMIKKAGNYLYAVSYNIALKLMVKQYSKYLESKIKLYEYQIKSLKEDIKNSNFSKFSNKNDINKKIKELKVLMKNYRKCLKDAIDISGIKKLKSDKSINLDENK